MSTFFYNFLIFIVGFIFKEKNKALIFVHYSERSCGFILLPFSGQTNSEVPPVPEKKQGRIKNPAFKPDFRFKAGFIVR